MNLPQSIADAVQPLFDALPLEQAMATLAPRRGALPALQAVVTSVLREKAIASRPALQSAIWLYVDELDRSHTISQGILDATGSYWHGIMHRREGDFSNAHYWFRKVGDHPAMSIDGHTFVDEAGAAHPEDPAALVQRQRDEWANLFVWCAKNH